MPAPISRWLVVASAALLILVAGGAGTWWYVHQPVPQHLTVYYADQQGMNLVPSEATVDFERPDAPGPWARALFDRLAHPADTKLLPAVSSRMTLVDASWNAPTWTLTVQLPDDSGTTQETLLAGALVRSFVASYPGAQKVRLRLLGSNGKPYAAQHLDLGDPLTPADFANQADSAPTGGLSATLWWKTRGGQELVPVQLPLDGGSGSPAHDAFDRLMSGPPAQAGHFVEAVAPSGLKASWAGQDGDIAHIDVTTALPAGAEGERFVRATVLTLTEFPGVHAVRFTHGNGPAGGKLGDFDLAQPVKRPANINAHPDRSSAQGTNP